MLTWFLRIGNGVGKQGYGNRPPIDDRNPIRKFSIDSGSIQNQRLNSASTDSPLQRIKEKSRYGISVSTPHRRYGHRLRTPFLRNPFPGLLWLKDQHGKHVPNSTRTPAYLFHCPTLQSSKLACFTLRTATPSRLGPTIQIAIFRDRMAIDLG